MEATQDGERIALFRHEIALREVCGKFENGARVVIRGEVARVLFTGVDLEQPEPRSPLCVVRWQSGKDGLFNEDELSAAPVLEKAEA